jgi:hypothetical protein
MLNNKTLLDATPSNVTSISPRAAKLLPNHAASITGTKFAISARAAKLATEPASLNTETVKRVAHTPSVIKYVYYQLNEYQLNFYH